MKILFSGGGTLGPVTPLLALYENILETEPFECVWVGTHNGPEEILVKNAGIRFVAFPASKLRRYFSVQTFIDIFVFFQALVQSFLLLRKEKPDVCISTGGYVSVPIHWAAWILGIPTWIHQQDVVVGLANRLMAPHATLITVVLEQSLSKFSKSKTRLLGNPVRPSIFGANKSDARRKFSLSDDLPVVFATGGGTGSEKINVLVAQVALELDNVCQIIHLTGKERKIVEPSKTLEHYHIYEFFDEEMKDAYAACDVVLSRGGFGTLSELSALKKPAIIIPKSGQQEDNIKVCVSSGAVLSCDEHTVTPLEVAQKIRTLLDDAQFAHTLGQRLSEVIPIASPESIKDMLLFVAAQK